MDVRAPFPAAHPRPRARRRRLPPPPRTRQLRRRRRVRSRRTSPRAVPTTPRQPDSVPGTASTAHRPTGTSSRGSSSPGSPKPTASSRPGGIVLVKCQPFQGGRAFHHMPAIVIVRAEQLGLRLIDELIHRRKPRPAQRGTDAIPCEPVEPARVRQARHRRVVMGFPRRDDRGDKPSFTITAKSRSWVISTGQNSRQGGGRTIPYERTIDRPSPTVTSQSRSWVISTGRDWHDGQCQLFDPTEGPVPTLTGKVHRPMAAARPGLDQRPASHHRHHRRPPLATRTRAQRRRHRPPRRTRSTPPLPRPSRRGRHPPRDVASPRPPILPTRLPHPRRPHHRRRTDRQRRPPTPRRGHPARTWPPNPALPDQPRVGVPPHSPSPR